MRGYRKGHNPITNALKTAGKAIGEGMDALAEANEAARLRAIEQGKIELEHRGLVEDALREYEKHVGRPYQLDSRFTTAKIAEPITGFNPALNWDPERKNHLTTCRESCHQDHCIACGRVYFGHGPYCMIHDV